jgi:hypothetical protein
LLDAVSDFVEALHHLSGDVPEQPPGEAYDPNLSGRPQKAAVPLLELAFRPGASDEKSSDGKAYEAGQKRDPPQNPGE